MAVRAALVVVAGVLAGCAHGSGAPAENLSARHHGASGSHGPLGHRFENAEEWAKRFDDPARDAWQRPDEVIGLMAIEPGMRVVDLGAGTGYFLRRISKAVGSAGAVLALDIEPGMIDYMAERCRREGLTNTRPLRVPLDDPKLDPGSVHRILIVNTWHHIPDRTAYVKKLARALVPGGAVYVVDFTLESEHGPPREHRIEPERVARELIVGWFETKLIEDLLPEQYVVAGRLLSP